MILLDSADSKNITLADIEGVIRQLGEAVAKIKPDIVGRQRDKGADLQYTGYVLLLQYEDPNVPGTVYTANPSKWHVENSALARFQARADLAITNGIVGPRAAIAANLLDHFGELKPILAILSALGALPLGLSTLLPDVLGETATAGSLLDELLNKKRAQ